MPKIALVTDSTADLTRDMKKNLNVHVIPLKISFGLKEYLDGELTSDQFYKSLESASELPRSSLPSSGDFSRLYQKLLEQHDEIISIHLSSKLSGTVNVARLAADTFKKKIHVVDSKNISIGIGLLVEEAARCIREDLPISLILRRLQLAGSNIKTFFTLDTLEYLHKGGRIGKVSSLLGSILKIKPIIQVNSDGIYIPVGKARTQSKALAQIVEQIHQLAEGRKIISMAVAHGAAAGMAEKLKEALESTLHTRVTYFTTVGSVIGVHTGPGTVGATVLFEY